MAASTIEPTNSIGHIPLEDPVSIAYSVSSIVNIALTYYKITEDPGEKEYASKIIWSMVNEWLEEIAPLRYVPGLVEEVTSMVKKKIWESGLEETLLEEIFVDTIVFKERALRGDEPEILRALAESLAAKTLTLIEALGGEIVEGTKTYEIIYGAEDPSEKIQLLTTLVGLLVVLSTNI